MLAGKKLQPNEENLNQKLIPYCVFEIETIEYPKAQTDKHKALTNNSLLSFRSGFLSNTITPACSENRATIIRRKV